MSKENEGERGYEEEAGPDIRYSDFVGRIVRDPNDPPDVQLLSGFLGASSEEGHVRLYLDEELRNYVEIPLDAIRHTQEIPPEQSPLGGLLVWIDRKAEVLHGKAGTERTRATFLEGQITKEFGGGAGGGGGAAAQPQSLAPGCVSQLQPCIPPTEGGPACISQIDFCIPRTEVGPLCHTLTGILCTHIGTLCRQSAFNPDCTRFGPKCPTALGPRCVSVQIPCITHDLACQVSSFAVCHAGPDPANQQQFAAQAFAAPGGGGFGGFGGGRLSTQLDVDCPSVVDPCATSDWFCPSQQIPYCQTESPNLCPTRYPHCPTGFPTCQPTCMCPSLRIPCPPVTINTVTCPSRFTPCPPQTGLRCPVSQIAICNITHQGCQVMSAACGINPAGGGGQQFAAEAFAAKPAGAGAAIAPTFSPVACYSVPALCPATVVQCPTFNFAQCPSVFVQACQTGTGLRCPTHAPLLCPIPTRFNCPSLSIPCQTRFGTCETLGACPSAVDACPTRFGCESLAGCFQTQACGVSQACGGGFPGGGFGGGGGQQFAAVHQGHVTIFNCPSIDVACDSRFIPGCRSHNAICQAP